MNCGGRSGAAPPVGVESLAEKSLALSGSAEHFDGGPLCGTGQAKPAYERAGERLRSPALFACSAPGRIAAGKGIN